MLEKSRPIRDVLMFWSILTYNKINKTNATAIINRLSRKSGRNAISKIKYFIKKLAKAAKIKMGIENLQAKLFSYIRISWSSFENLIFLMIFFTFLSIKASTSCFDYSPNKKNIKYALKYLI